jgi:hypothetical protein
MMDKLLLRIREGGGGSPSPLKGPSSAIKKHNLSNYAKVIGGEVSVPKRSVFQHTEVKEIL